MVREGGRDPRWNGLQLRFFGSALVAFGSAQKRAVPKKTSMREPEFLLKQRIKLLFVLLIFSHVVKIPTSGPH